RADDRGERTHGTAFGPRQPFRLVLGRGDRGEETDLRPAEDSGLERCPEPWQALEARAHGREVLEPAGGEAEPLPAVVSEPAEAELVVTAPAEERTRESAEDRPTARVLGREAPQPAVEHERGVVRAEASAVGFRRDE